MDCHNFVLSISTQKIDFDLKNLEDLIEFSNLKKNHEISSFKSKNTLGIFKNENTKNLWKDRFVALRSESCSFESNGKNTIKLKVTSESQSKYFIFEELLFLEEIIKKNVITS